MEQLESLTNPTQGIGSVSINKGGRHIEVTSYRPCPFTTSSISSLIHNSIFPFCTCYT